MSHLASLDQRFSGRPHVGSVRHFDGLDLEAAVARIRLAARALEVEVEGESEIVEERRTFSGTAPLSLSDGMELWVIVTEHPDVGVKVETRVFHQLEDSAVADEYLVQFAARLAEASHHEAPGKDHHGGTD